MENFLHDEPTFLTVEEEWYGIRYFFQDKKRWTKEVLEVTFYPDLHTYSYRYMKHSWRGMHMKEHAFLNHLDETLPFWVRKVFFQFSK